MSDMNTGFDPYEELMLHRHNIDQLIVGLTDGSNIMKQLNNKLHEHQNLIHQLVQQNHRLNELYKQSKLEIVTLQNELTLIKSSL